MRIPRVLIIEDTPVTAWMLQKYLSNNGFHATVEGDGRRGLAVAQADRPDAIILDNNLPGMDGFEVCAKLRSAQYSGVIVMLSARDDDRNRISGLELGADDYLPKPVKLALLKAHLVALLRRVLTTAPAESPDELRYGSLAIKQSSREVRDGERLLALTDKEFDVLWLLAKSPGLIVSRHTLSESIRLMPHLQADRSLDMTVSRLRRSLGKHHSGREHIKSVRGKGYLFNESGWD